jgi:hypothetical protein
MSDRSQRIVHERYIAMFQAIRIVQVVSGEGIHRTGMSVEYLNAGLRNARAFKRSPPMGFGYVLPTRPGNHYPSTGLDQYGVNVSFTVHAARVLGITVSDFDGTGRQWRRHKIRATALFNMPVG